MNSKSNYKCHKIDTGFTLIELLVTLAILSLVIAGMTQFVGTQTANSRQQKAQLDINENLRIAMSRVTDELRNAKFMTPRTSLSTWVTGTDKSFTLNPTISPASGDDSVTITTLSARAEPIGKLISDLSILSNDFIIKDWDKIIKRDNLLLSINHQEFVKAVVKPNPSDAAITAEIKFDSNPNDGIVQTGLTKNYLADSAVYVLLPKSYKVNKANRTLLVNKYDGQGYQVVMDNIADMTITGASGLQRYSVTLTAQSDYIDQDTGSVLTRAMTSNVTLKN